MSNLKKENQFRQKFQKPSRNQGLPLQSFPRSMLHPDGAWKKSLRLWSALTTRDWNSSWSSIAQMLNKYQGLLIKCRTKTRHISRVLIWRRRRDGRTLSLKHSTLRDLMRIIIILSNLSIGE
ncbi:hypothetical protein KY290_028499 [Solanum tuberosum]|uniref:Uncharacterized protein n=1 Tax=Solanum tuberosum TaxID=4113 RepID=A0ABQ7UI31_SOLTU|nr:hypothetical protein KY290_028499 [Solanum tuberosum]